MSKDTDSSAPAPVADATPDISSILPPPKERFLPTWILAILLIMLVVGLYLILTRDQRERNKAIAAMRSADAYVLKDPVDGPISGLKDTYGLIKFNQGREALMRVLSLCESRPDMMLGVVREMLDDSNPSAQLIALHSANFLALNGRLTADDVAKIASLMKPEVPLDVRKGAQRVLSSIILLPNVEKATDYQALPPNLAPSTNSKLPHKVQTRVANFGASPMLEVRWTSADLADAWWKSNAGKGVEWNGDSKRYVVK